MSVRTRVRRGVRFVVHNWPLKLAAIALATLLYAGLVVSQDSDVFPGPVTVTTINVPPGTRVTNELRPVEQIRYIGPADVGRLRAGDFTATVDLANVEPSGQPVNVRVMVTAVDPDVTIISYEPRSVQVVLDDVISKTVPVRVEQGTPPAGIEKGKMTYEPTEVTIKGAAAAVDRVVAARVTVPLDDPSAIDVDREVEAEPVDDAGEVVKGVDVEPRSVHVKIPLLTNKESRTLPVNPILTGAPAQGFRIASVSADPLTVSVEGDADQLAALTQADTAPVAIFGATSDVTQVVTLALPSGVAAVDTATVRVTVHVEAVTVTRTFDAGLRLDGRAPDLDYRLSVTTVLLTVFGPVADLDVLGAAPIEVAVNVAGLAPGSHDIAVVPSLPSTVKLVETSPETVVVTITVPPTLPPPSTSPEASAPAASPSESPSIAP